MGTRGTLGVRIDGTDKLCYNHFDSYPEGLGVDVLKDVTSMLGDWGLEKIQTQARKMTQVHNDVPPTPEQIIELAEFVNLEVGEQSDDDWYCILRDLQGKLRDLLTIGYMEEGNTFILDSLFCEWGYILNLDEGVLEVYEGFQDAPHDKGRYAKMDASKSHRTSQYFPCAMIVSFPLDALPTPEEFTIAITLAKFDSIEEAVVDWLQDNGELSIEDARTKFGLYENRLTDVIECIEDAGHEVVHNDDSYELA